MANWRMLYMRGDWLRLGVVNAPERRHWPVFAYRAGRLWSVMVFGYGVFAIVGLFWEIR